MFFFENYFGRRHQRNRQIAQTLGSLKRAVAPSQTERR
jgi:hypothetical protein